MKNKGVEAEEGTILLISGFLPHTYSQIESSFVELSEHSDEYSLRYLWLVPDAGDKRGQAPLYVSMLKKKGIPFVSGCISKYNFVHNIKLFHHIFTQHEIQAIYVHFGYERFWGALFAKLYRKKLIWNEHCFTLGRKSYSRPLKLLFYRSFVDCFISISDFITRSLPKNVPVVTLPNGICADIQSEKSVLEVRTRVRRELGVSDQQRLVLMVAAFTKQKRHDLAIKICKVILDKNANTKFVFLGEGGERAVISEKIVSLGIDKNFFLPGYVADVDKYYMASDMCMLTAVNEGFGYCILEAMKYSKPVVAFRSGGPVEVVRDAETGFLVDDGCIAEFSKKLLLLINDEKLSKYMGSKARLLLEEKFTRSAWITQINSALRDVLWETKS